MNILALKACYVLALALPLAAAVKPRPAGAAPGTPDSYAGTRFVTYSEREIIPLHARLRFTMVIALPEGERILDFLTGDKEFWSVTGAANFAYIKPAKERARTNLTLVTDAGRLYTFTLTETTDAEPDQRVYVKLPQDNRTTPARFVPVAAVENYERELEAARSAIVKVRQDADARLAEADKRATEAREEALKNHAWTIRAGYVFRREDTFRVEGVWHDERFTYISAVPRETPIIYAFADGKPAVVLFEYRDGLFRINKVIRRGYLQIGKKRLQFHAE